MKLARVIGTVTLNRRHPNLTEAGALKLVRAATRESLAGVGPEEDEPLVAYDQLGARDGDQVAIADGREASSPFRPAKVPCDAYLAAVMEQISFRPILPVGPGAEPTESSKTE